MVLQKMYNNFAAVADNITNWRSISKNDLLNSYIDNEDNPALRESYIAAIFCRYWNAINKYYRSSSNSASIEDCFEWLTHAILYALKHRKWRDPNNNMYGDACGPDKIVNRCIASTRKIYYQANNNDNRKVNFGLESIERLQDNKLSYVLPADSCFESSCLDSIVYKDMIQQLFEKNPIQALVVDGIINGDAFENNKNEHYVIFSKRRLAKHLRNLNDKYMKHIANLYNVPEFIITESSENIKEIPSIKLYKIIDHVLVGLRKNLTAEPEL